MGMDDELNNLRAERSVRHDIHENEEQEDEERDVAGWMEAIGPEDLSREQVMENLEQYGFDRMREDDIVDEADDLTASDTPYWASDNDVEEVGERLDQIENSGQSFRPVEDNVLDHLAEDDTEEA